MGNLRRDRNTARERLGLACTRLLRGFVIPALACIVLLIAGAGEHGLVLLVCIIVFAIILVAVVLLLLAKRLRE